MSADNGVYILESPIFGTAPDGTLVHVADEHRVAYAGAIENIDDPTEGLKYEVILFGESLVYYNKQEAILWAHKIADNCVYLEYGVRVIKRDHAFPQVLYRD